MTTPIVDTVRTIPLVEKDFCEPMEAETSDSGFPFDREDRDDHFRSQLDDIAKRHPEFAEHLEGFPFRSDSLGRRRPPRPSDQEFRRFVDRPFGSSRFERFGFPFSDPFEEDHLQQEVPPREQTQPKSQPQEEEEKPKPERGRKQNIQQSNTVDLGQKQEPVNDRNQRSMSAPPPDNRQRYVSSIHIPINRDGGMGDMGKAQSQPQPQQQQEKPVNKPTERVIPIHVEGRDEPVMPKHTGPTTYTQPQAERAYTQPQPERIFGHSPSHFTQFVGREPPRQYAAGPEWHHFGPDTRQQQKFQQQTPPPQQQKFQQQDQQRQVPVQRDVPPQPQQPQPSAKTCTPIDTIQLIQKDVSELMGQVEKFNGMPRDKQYLYLDEMLTRNLIKLDNIDTQGQENIRQARKEAIKCIESCIGILEAKAAANVPREKPAEAESKPSEEVKSEEVAEVKPEEVQKEQEMMEVENKEKTENTQEKMEVEVKNEEPKVEEKVEKVEEVKEKVEEAVKPVEEKMEVVPEEQPKEKEVKEDKPQESSQDSASKPEEETKEVPVEAKPEGETKESSQEEKAEDSDDKKEKKKGKKKVVKK